jgi:uncharacterized protein (DUF2384 family)
VFRKSAVEKALGSEVVSQIVGEGPLGGARSEKLRCIWEGLLDTRSPQQATEWLQSSAPALHNRRPLDIMLETDGLDRVLELVTRLTWGLTE